MKNESLFSAIDRRQFVTVTELAQLSGFSGGQIRTAVANGEIPGARRRKRGKWKIPRNGAEKWWSRLQQTTCA
jgi:excisionase family DNA binding protein